MNRKPAIVVTARLHPDAMADFESWHAQTHLPHILAIPGIERARRVRRRPEAPGVYEMELELADESALQKALNSAEAEIAAGCMMGKRIPFIRQLLADCTFKLDRPIIIFLDNTAALALIEKMGASPKTAHFLRWQFYLRYLTVNKHIVPLFTDTKNMLADPMTKVVDSPTLSRFLEVACNTRNIFISKR